MATLAEKVRDAGLELPEPLQPGGHYESFSWSGQQLWVAGQLPRVGEEVQFAGAVGADVTLSDAQAAAALCALNTLSVVTQAVEGVSDQLRLVNVSGFVRCAADFVDHAKVVDGASEVFLRVLGDRGKHARTAVGTYALPRGVPVEIATVWEVAR
ncbi:RidA family protein [Nocardioides sp. NPDC087217]|uniref:RidA family protein n=1 Tax=Nocardioides sp. NPDC087217 TaxID=3364335 RepID=UPI003819A124